MTTSAFPQWEAAMYDAQYADAEGLVNAWLANHPDPQQWTPAEAELHHDLVVMAHPETEAALYAMAASSVEPYREVWDSSLPPGGYVCAACGEPVESEPCPEHAPTGYAGGAR